MASASSSGGVAGRLRNASLVLVGDNDSTISDIRKAVTLMKNIAVQLEKDNQTEKLFAVMVSEKGELVIRGE
ncbi:hypothetical protein F2Q70_00023394 [Brassica cretica]|uniref:Uncharacterized protein n=1 Tax=Brassica cretica TaxID=69181 RepID=A0A8S9GXZ7_BRACR|nr:hypothetical protein F2Q70_00023394 [Brassica cretica]